MAFCEIQVCRDLDAARAAQVAVEVELFLQLQKLRVGVRSAQASRVASLGVRTPVFDAAAGGVE